MGLVAPQHVESSQTRNPTHIPCMGRRILNHWTTREVPSSNFLFDKFTVGSLHIGQNIQHVILHLPQGDEHAETVWWMKVATGSWQPFQSA